MDGAVEPNKAHSMLDLKKSASQLMEKLDSGDFMGATNVIRAINEARDHSIYHEVGKLTRGLHEAIVNFHIDAGIDALRVDGEASGIKDATDRLDYVLTATQRAANTTMDMVEHGIPIAIAFSEEAELLQKEWTRLAKREITAEEFRELYKRIENFLELSVNSAGRLKDDFNNILLAQDYQDLTGQVIHKVIKLVHEVETSLVGLVRMASEVERYTGVLNSVEEISKARTTEAGKSLTAEGPVINAAERDDVCNGQDDVDDLLSSLGF